MLRLTIVAAATLTLAACGGSDDPSPREVDSAIANAGAQAEAMNDQAEVSPAPVPAATPAIMAIPAAFHGRWGMVPNDCDPTRDDAKGLIEIDPTGLKFYESRARLTEVTSDAPETFTGTFAYSGEGQQWTKTETLTLSGSSNTLVRSSDGEEYRYVKCPAT